ncbi:MAG: DegT/DnrJ/EryC1/StrS family aminotransferase [Alkalispirochaeta sp.]
MSAIPFARPSIGEDEIAAVADVLRSGWLTTGRHALAFESEFAAAVGSPHALAVNSATAGLHLALDAVGVGPGDVVIVPSLTFAATAEVARYLGAEVAFADIGPDSLLIDPTSVARLADNLRRNGHRVSAIIPVHLAGEPCDMDALTNIARDHGAALIEDAAHAFPAGIGDRAAGTIGDIGVFSFYANKTITTGEGGMVVTEHEEYAHRMAMMRSHGIDRQAWHRYTDAGTDQRPARPSARTPEGIRATDSGTDRYATPPHWYYQILAPGFKYNLPDTAAAIGRVQLRRAGELHDARTRLAMRYRTTLEPLARAGLIELPTAHSGHAWHLFILRLHVDKLTITRDQFIEELRMRGIGTSVHYIPLHHMPYWRNRRTYLAGGAAVSDAPQPSASWDAPGLLAHTDARFREIVSIPLYPDLRLSDQDRVIAAVTHLVEAHRAE